MSDGSSFVKYGAVIQFSREMALDYGLVQPTEQERAERTAWAEAFRAEKAAAQPAIREALRRLDALDGPDREVLDLHAREGVAYFSCTGCDYAGYEAEAPQWPCRTADLIAHRHGIDLSDLDRYGLEGA